MTGDVVEGLAKEVPGTEDDVGGGGATEPVVGVVVPPELQPAITRTKTIKITRGTR